MTLPEQTVIWDRDLGTRYPDKAFYLRVTRSNHHVDHIDLDGQQTLPGAVRAADALGYQPTHWMEVGKTYFSEIPASIIREAPAAAPAKTKDPAP
jgi:hypothetical protein